MCEADRQTGTSRFVHSEARGTIDTIGDRVGGKSTHLHVPFVPGVPLRVDVPLRVVRVHAVRGQADGILRDALALAVVLRHDVIGDHAAGLAHVQLVGPAAVVGELVAAVTPAADFVADLLGNSRMIGQGPQQALLVKQVLLEDPLPLGVISGGPVGSSC